MTSTKGLENWVLSEENTNEIIYKNKLSSTDVWVEAIKGGGWEVRKLVQMNNLMGFSQMYGDIDWLTKKPMKKAAAKAVAIKWMQKHPRG
jgi:hypothetical protein